jgi:hypothetical protein
MTRRRLFAGLGGTGLLAAAAVGLAWATGLIFAGPSQSAWAADVCAALQLNPTENDSWQAMRDEHDAALLALAETELPAGTEDFHSAVVTGTRLVRNQLNGYARSDPDGGLRPMLEDLQEIAQTRPRGPSADGALSIFYTSVRESEALIRSAADSLPTRSREAIEDVPGCAERLRA